MTIALIVYVVAVLVGVVAVLFVVGFVVRSKARRTPPTYGERLAAIEDEMGRFQAVLGSALIPAMERVNESILALGRAISAAGDTQEANE